MKQDITVVERSKTMAFNNYISRWLKSALLDRAHNRQKLKEIWDAPSIYIEVMSTSYNTVLLALTTDKKSVYVFEIAKGEIFYKAGYQKTNQALTGRSVTISKKVSQQIQLTCIFVQDLLDQSIWTF